MAGTLPGGNMGPVRRVGDTVHRTAGPWTISVHAYLRHLSAAGIGGIPRPIGATKDREVLSFVPGEVPRYPLPSWVWGEQVLRDGARLLRRLHDATADVDHYFGGRAWQMATHEPREVMCHNDFAPHNLVFDAEHRLIGAIDFDMCSPGPRIRDVAYFATRAVPLGRSGNSDVLLAAERDHRIQVILDAYGAEATVAQIIDESIDRLYEIADFSDRKAIELGKPELAAHAYDYRQDAVALADGSA